jgi:hypothetical protein
MKLVRFLLILAMAVATAIAVEIRVASLNAYLLFDPRINHPGKVDDENRLTLDAYTQKLSNLGSLARSADFVGVQEVGGEPEVTALAKAAGPDFVGLTTKSKDTFTGQAVGALVRLPGWKIVNHGRVPVLDRLLSKHLLVTATRGTDKIHFLVIHLIRPIASAAEKNAAQLDAIRLWAEHVAALDPAASIVVLGDTNNTKKAKGSSLIGIGHEANELNRWAATHINKSCYDRIILVGPGEWRNPLVTRPPYGPKPNKTNLSLWTDHLMISSELHR